MTESNQICAVPLSVSKEKKGKIFYEHGKVSRASKHPPFLMTGACSLPCSQDALELALSVANIQEDKALRKAEKHRQPQVTETSGLVSAKRQSTDCQSRMQIGRSRAERRYRNYGDRRKRLVNLQMECHDPTYFVLIPRRTQRLRLQSDEPKRRGRRRGPEKSPKVGCDRAMTPKLPHRKTTRVPRLGKECHLLEWLIYQSSHSEQLSAIWRRAIRSRFYCCPPGYSIAQKLEKGLLE